MLFIHGKHYYYYTCRHKKNMKYHIILMTLILMKHNNNESIFSWQNRLVVCTCDTSSFQRRAGNMADER